MKSNRHLKMKPCPRLVRSPRTQHIAASSLSQEPRVCRVGGGGLSISLRRVLLDDAETLSFLSSTLGPKVGRFQGLLLDSVPGLRAQGQTLFCFSPLLHFIHLSSF